MFLVFFLPQSLCSVYFVLGLGSWVLGLGSWVLGLGSWVLGLGSWVLGLCLRVICLPLLLDIAQPTGSETVTSLRKAVEQHMRANREGLLSVLRAAVDSPTSSYPHFFFRLERF
jgi:hypothetical protein